MEISPLTTNTPIPTSTPDTSASTQITSDFEMFLTMMTAQIQYQDPLNPVDSTDYSTQLATFSGVEQAVLTNDLLKSLTTQMGAGSLIDMAGLVGKEVRSSAPALFDGQPITLLPNPTSFADSAEVIVRDDAGLEVQRLPIAPTAETFDWAGVDADGSPMPTGLYSFEVVSTSGGVVISQKLAEMYGTVNEVRLDNGQTTLVLSGGAAIPTDAVTAVREGGG